MKKLPAQKQNSEPGQMVGPQLYIKILAVHFVNSVLDNHDWDMLQKK